MRLITAGVIESIQRVFNYANTDDDTSHWTLNLRDGGKGNIKKIYEWGIKFEEIVSY